MDLEAAGLGVAAQLQSGWVMFCGVMFCDNHGLQAASRQRPLVVNRG